MHQVELCLLFFAALQSSMSAPPNTHNVPIRSENPDPSYAFSKIDFSSATSTLPSIGENGLEEYASDRALEKGPGYWCSEGHHANGVVTWKGRLKNRRTIEGVKIEWEYAPNDVSIYSSLDESTWINVVPWRSLANENQAFDQMILFDQPVQSKSVRIDMKSPKAEYFGIRLVQLIGGGNPLLRIHSGITSVEELCLSGDNKGDVTIEGCIDLVATGKNMDAWRLTEKSQIKNIRTDKCMVLKENIVTDGGDITLMDCENSYNLDDGRSIWEMQANNQLRLLRAGDFCLSFKGSKAGLSDVALNKPALCSHPMPDDPKHSSESALDGKPETSWKSQAFMPDGIPDAVYFDVDLGTMYKLRKLNINWKHPPLSFGVLLSKDGKNWTEVASDENSWLFVTTLDLQNEVSRFFRLIMKKPHPLYGKYGDNFIYEISSLNILSNRLKLIVDDCKIASNSIDARDKFFFELISELNEEAYSKFEAIKQSINDVVLQTSSRMSAIDSMDQALLDCLETKKQRESKIATLHNELVRNAEDLHRIVKSVSNRVRVKDVIGFKNSLPASGCREIRNQHPDVGDGFFWIRSNCMPEALRLFCNMNTGESFLLAKGTVDYASLCPRKGLESWSPTSVAEVAIVERMIKIMEYDTSSPIIFARDVNNTGSYMDLMSKSELNSVLLGAGIGGVGKSAGFTPDGLRFFDQEKLEPSAVICTAQSLNEITPIDITCKTRGVDLPWPSLSNGVELFIRCPQDCSVKEGSLVGTSAYRMDSSVCISAVHAGAYGSGRVVKVQGMGEVHEFDGTEANGISSEDSLESAPAFSVAPFLQECPVIMSSPTTFIEIDANDTHPAKPENFTSVIIDRSENIDYSTGSAIGMLSYFINSATPIMDESYISILENEALSRISKARKTLKPSELREKELQIKSAELNQYAKEIADYLENTAQYLSMRVENADESLHRKLNQRFSQSGFASWKLHHFNVFEFNDVFETPESSEIENPGVWKLADGPVAGFSAENMISGKSDLDMDKYPAMGLMSVSHKNFFDFVFSTDIYISGPGVAGLGFRLKNLQNGYIFEMRQDGKKGFKRLLKLENGAVTELCKNIDGGFVENVWINIKIKTKQSRITIGVKPSDGSFSEIFDIMDGTYVSGSVGFLAQSGAQAFFKNIAVEALPCTIPPSNLSPPEPVNCSIYQEGFMGHFTSSWHAIEPLNAVGNPSNWKYTANIGGKNKVITQLCETKTTGNDDEPVLAILKRHRSCTAGIFSFSFFPQCLNGVIGGVVNYIDPNNYVLFEMGSSFARLRTKVNGVFSTRGKSIIARYDAGTWNKVSISIYNEAIVVTAGTETFSAFPVASIIGGGKKNGKVGLAVYNCAGVAFSDIHLHPFNREVSEMKRPSGVVLQVQQFLEKSAPVECWNLTAMGRLNFCSKIASLQVEVKRCKESFCDHCCANHPSSTAEHCKNECYSKDVYYKLAQSQIADAIHSCSPSEAGHLYSVCDDESQSDREKCETEICSHCCHTVRIDRQKLSDNDVTIFRQACIRTCSRQ